MAKQPQTLIDHLRRAIVLVAMWLRQTQRDEAAQQE